VCLMLWMRMQGSLAISVRQEDLQRARSRGCAAGHGAAREQGREAGVHARQVPAGSADWLLQGRSEAARPRGSGREASHPPGPTRALGVSTSLLLPHALCCVVTAPQVQRIRHGTRVLAPKNALRHQHGLITRLNFVAAPVLPKHRYTETSSTTRVPLYMVPVGRVIPGAK